MLMLTPDGLVVGALEGAFVVPPPIPPGTALSDGLVWPIDDELGGEPGPSGVAGGIGFAGLSGVAGWSGAVGGKPVAGGSGAAGDRPPELPAPEDPDEPEGDGGGTFAAGGTGICCGVGVGCPGTCPGTAGLDEPGAAVPGAVGRPGTGVWGADWAKTSPVPAVARAAPSARHRIVRIPRR